MLRSRFVSCSTTISSFSSITSFCSFQRRNFAAGVRFDLTDDQIAIVDAAEGFTKSTFEPNAAKWDREHIFPLDALKEAASLGFGGIYTQPEFGGSGLSRLEASLIFEQMSMSDPSTTAFLSIHNMATWMVDSYGSKELRAELIPRLCTMDLVASYCLTEPTSGSDAAALRTSAVDAGDHYVVSGSKAFISGAGASGIYVVMCRTGEPGPKGISCLVIDGNLPGVSFGKDEDKLGWRSQPTKILNLDNVKVPKTHRLGTEGEGFKIAMKGLDGGRINIATCSLGSAQRCLDTSLEYARNRKQFGKAISDFQVTQFKFADMATKIQTSRLTIRAAAKALDRKDAQATQLCAMAKVYGTEQCFHVVDEALQIHGGYGYLNDYPIERHLRDLRVHRILEGTNEIMRMIISRGVMHQ